MHNCDELNPDEVQPLLNHIDLYFIRVRRFAVRMVLPEILALPLYWIGLNVQTGDATMDLVVAEFSNGILPLYFRGS